MAHVKRILVAVTVILAATYAAPSSHAAPSSPVGALDSVSERAGGWILYGWLWDPTQSQPIVSAEVNGEPDGYTLSFTQPRPDVVAAYPGAPLNPGFLLPLDRPMEGEVCVYALGPSLQKTAGLGCRSLPPTFAGSPAGALDEVTPGVGRMTVSGWAADQDPDAPDPNVPPQHHLVHLYVDGRLFAWIRTGVARPDVGAAVPFAGTDAGYWEVLPARAGSHRVCAYAINEGGTGRNVFLGCRDVVVSAASGPDVPFGYVDGSYIARFYGSASADFGVTGWAAATDQRDVTVRVLAVGGYLGQGDGQWDVTGTTGESRPDVVDALPGTRPDTGFHIEAGGGHVFQYTLACVVARVAHSGADALLGCVSDPQRDGFSF